MKLLISKLNILHVPQRDDVNTKPTNDKKLANMNAIDFVYETFIAFKGDKPIDCDNNMKNSIKRIQYNLSEYSLTFVYK